jgi:hypothetical protein
MPVPKTAGQSKRVRKIMIVAVARKLAIALRRYVELGLVPQGAIINSPIKPFAALWRAPVSSTAIHVALERPFSPRQARR